MAYGLFPHSTPRSSVLRERQEGQDPESPVGQRCVSLSGGPAVGRGGGGFGSPCSLATFTSRPAAGF
eukprot:4172359-Pyramimonas_sp.AAC.1